ncbi:MAG: DUF2442 domain-containing protein [Bacteroidia bacterium]
MKKVSAEIKNKYLIIKKGEKEYRFEINKISKRLAEATEEQLSDFSVSPSGYGIHWNKIDEDISIPSLLNEPVAEYGKKK